MDEYVLTETQRQRLEQQLLCTRDALLFRRTLAVLEAAEGRPISEVARLVRTSRPSVYQWLDWYRSTGDPSSLTDQRGGNRPTLWTEELKSLLKASLQVRPDRLGYSAVEWTVGLLQEHLARLCGVRPCATSVRQQLHALDYVWKRPRYVLAPDPDAEKKTPN
jgi:transposase